MNRILNAFTTESRTFSIRVIHNRWVSKVLGVPDVILAALKEILEGGHNNGAV